MLAHIILIHNTVLWYDMMVGMTIPFLEVSFNGVFENGQGYVALSRATYLPTCLEGLTLTSFHENSIIKAHPKVCDFYNRISSSSSSSIISKALSSSLSSSSSHEGSTVMQQSVDIITQIGRVFARQFNRELPPLHMDNNDGWMNRC